MTLENALYRGQQLYVPVRGVSAAGREKRVKWVIDMIGLAGFACALVVDPDALLEFALLEGRDVAATDLSKQYVAAQYDERQELFVKQLLKRVLKVAIDGAARSRSTAPTTPPA